MEYNQILELVKEVAKAGLSDFEYQEGEVRIAMSCPVTKSVSVIQNDFSQPAQPVDNKSNEVTEVKGKEITSPIVGTFYAAPSENEAPYVKVGDRVTKGQTVAIVEAMKLMNEIASEYDGVITEICVNNTETVEYGQVLFRIQD